MKIWSVRNWFIFPWYLNHPKPLCFGSPAGFTWGIQYLPLHDYCPTFQSHSVHSSSPCISYLHWTDPSCYHLPHLLTSLPHYDEETVWPVPIVTQSELPPHQSTSPIPVPAPTSPNSSLLSYLSSLAPLDTSSSLTAVDPEYGLDEDAVAHNQSFIMHMDNNQLVISSSTTLLHVLSLIALLSFSLSAFGVLVEAIIERTAPTTCTPTVIFPCQDTLKLLVCLPNAIFAVIGEIANDSVQPGFVTCANKKVTLLTTVQLTFFSWSRLPISLGLPLPLDRDLPSGVLIKPRVWLYEGGNVTICLLASGVFLFSLHHRTHLLFGMFSYDWIHCLLLFDSLNVSFIEL